MFIVLIVLVFALLWCVMEDGQPWSPWDRRKKK